MIKKTATIGFYIIMAIFVVIIIGWRLRSKSNLNYISNQLNVESNWNVLEQGIRDQFPVGMSRQAIHQKAVEIDPETPKALLFEKGEELLCEFPYPCCEEIFLFYNRIGEGGALLFCYEPNMTLKSIGASY